LLGFRIHPHMFRNTFISNQRIALSNKVTDVKFIIDCLTGHKPSKTMFDLYTDKKVFEDELRKSMQELHYMKDLKI